MSATVAAALKKIAVAILTDKKLRKAVLGIVLGIIIIVIMPVVAVIALFNGDINIDTDRLQQIVVEEMSDEEKAKLQAVEDTMKAIEMEYYLRYRHLNTFYYYITQALKQKA